MLEPLIQLTRHNNIYYITQGVQKSHVNIHKAVLDNNGDWNGEKNCSFYSIWRACVYAPLKKSNLVSLSQWRMKLFKIAIITASSWYCCDTTVKNIWTFFFAKPSHTLSHNNGKWNFSVSSLLFYYLFVDIYLLQCNDVGEENIKQA